MPAHSPKQTRACMDARTPAQMVCTHACMHTQTQRKDKAAAYLLSTAKTAEVLNSHAHMHARACTHARMHEVLGSLYDGCLIDDDQVFGGHSFMFCSSSMSICVRGA